jgi:hypothetical protein
MLYEVHAIITTMNATAKKISIIFMFVWLGIHINNKLLLGKFHVVILVFLTKIFVFLEIAFDMFKYPLIF